ncbi:hypothetical protein ACFFRR_004886 [Megaselia abdita]
MVFIRSRTFVVLQLRYSLMFLLNHRQGVLRSTLSTVQEYLRRLPITFLMSRYRGLLVVHSPHAVFSRVGLIFRCHPFVSKLPPFPSLLSYVLLQRPSFKYGHLAFLGFL